MAKKIIIDFAVPLLATILLTVVLGVTNADIEIGHRFYSPVTGWFLSEENPWHWLYEYGNIPALCLSIGGFIAFLGSFFQKKFLAYRRTGLFLVAFMLLGPGLLVNAVFKDHWGRPRPIDTVNFGGAETFRHPWEKGQPGMGKSFPSGHASVGFFLFSPFFLLRNRSRGWAVFFLCLGLSYGMLMGTGRMIQGGHYASDVLWSGAMTYLTGLTLYYVFRFYR